MALFFFSLSENEEVLQKVLAREVWLLAVTRYSVDERMRSNEVGVFGMLLLLSQLLFWIFVMVQDDSTTFDLAGDMDNTRVRKGCLYFTQKNKPNL